MRHCRGKYRRILRKSILTQAKKLPTSVSYGNQKLYFNPMIFRLENLAVVENTVKHIHFQGHIEKLNALQQSCVIYFYFFFPAGLNSLDTKFAERTCYVFLNAPKIKFSIEDFFSKCDRTTRNCGFGYIYYIYFLCNVYLLKSMVKNLFKFKSAAVKHSFIHLIIALMQFFCYLFMKTGYF